MALDISQLKNIGMIQNTYMWEANIPVIPILGITNFKFLVRTTSIPGKTRGNNTLRFQGEQFNLPGALSHEGTWSCDVLLSETHDVYDTFVKWNKLVTEYATKQMINLIKAEIQLKLQSVNKNVVTKRFRLLGAYPLGIPGVDSLDQAGTEGVVTQTYQFSIDDIDEDELNVLTF